MSDFLNNYERWLKRFARDEERIARKARHAATARPARVKAKCGAFARSTGKPCQMKALANGRCRLHGGLSTGPKTVEGKAKALANLKQYKSVV